MGEANDRSALADKAAGAFLGAAIGDALGWPQEQNSRNLAKKKFSKAQVKFYQWERRAGGRFYAYREAVQAGEYSDDTQLLLATARSLQHNSTWTKVLYRFELPFWLSYERGGGGATKRAAECWLNGKSPWLHADYSPRYFQAGGNGVAMRITPHVFVPEQTLSTLFKQVMLNGIATHGHPRALVGALAYAYALWLASRTEGTLEYGSLINQLLDQPDLWGAIPVWDHAHEEWMAVAQNAFANEYGTVWKSSVDELLQGLRTAQSALKKGALSVSRDVLGQLGAFDPDINGAGTISTVAVLYLASRYAADPVTGVLEAAFAEGTDSDTYASMVGGLLGAIRGNEWIHPEWRQVQDASYIASLAASLVEGKTSTQTPFADWDKKAQTDLMRRLGRPQAHEVNIGLLGPAKVVDRITHEAIAKSSRAQSWKTVTPGGQTLYFTKFSRVEDPATDVAPQRVTGEQPAEQVKGRGDFTPKSAQSGHEKLLQLFDELAHSFPPHVSASAAFDVVTEVLRQSELVRKELSDHPDTPPADRDAWFRRLLQSNSVLGRHLTVRELKQVLKKLFAYLE